MVEFGNISQFRYFVKITLINDKQKINRKSLLVIIITPEILFNSFISTKDRIFSQLKLTKFASPSSGNCSDVAR